jgi:hypothetical protein
VLWLVVDLDVELDVAGVHTGGCHVDAVGLTGILLTRQLLSQSAFKDSIGLHGLQLSTSVTASSDCRP